MKRFCRFCNEQKEITEFNKSKLCKLGYDYCCKTCGNKRSVLARAARRSEINNKENKKNRDRKSFIVKHMGGVCLDCKQNYPDCVYDLHHLDPKEKDIGISRLDTINEKLFKELEKCVLLCSNCHRIRHQLPQ